MPSLAVIRGYPGSGRTTLARKIAAGGLVLSIDDYLGPVPEGEDIISSLEHIRATYLLNKEIQRAVTGGTPNIVVDTLGARLWEIRTIWDLARQAGYAVSVHTPETPWARDPERCEAMTKFKLNEMTWSMLIEVWESPARAADVDASFTPEERLQQARWIALGAEDQQDPLSNNKKRFLLDNYIPEVSKLTSSGFIGPKGRIVREAFALEMKNKSLKPPVLVEMPIKGRSISEIENAIQRPELQPLDHLDKPSFSSVSIDELDKALRPKRPLQDFGPS